MPKETYRGVFKIQEEMNELGVELAKLAPFPNGDHPSPKYAERTIDQAIREEIADVQAALTYFVEQNPQLAPDPERVEAKLAKFRRWKLSGLRVEGTAEGRRRQAKAVLKRRALAPGENGWVSVDPQQDGGGVYRVGEINYKIVPLEGRVRAAFVDGQEVARASKFPPLIRKLYRLSGMVPPK